MSDRRMDDDLPLTALSALADGEADAAEVARACAAWRDDGKVRTQWNTYHLIGDVMRSDELADASSSTHFLKSFRERLAQEPVVLAPAGLVARHQPAMIDVGLVASQPVPTLRRRVWAGPLAVAASFVMVVGALVTHQGGLPQGSGVSASSLAQNGFAAPGGMQTAFAPSTGGTPSWADNGVTADSLAAGASFPSAEISDPAAAGAAAWRDPQLEQALSARRVQTMTEQSFAAHGGLARHVLYEMP